MTCHIVSQRFSLEIPPNRQMGVRTPLVKHRISISDPRCSEKKESINLSMLSTELLFSKRIQAIRSRCYWKGGFHKVYPSKERYERNTTGHVLIHCSHAKMLMHCQSLLFNPYRLKHTRGALTHQSCRFCMAILSVEQFHSLHSLYKRQKRWRRRVCDDRNPYWVSFIMFYGTANGIELISVTSIYLFYFSTYF